MTHKLFPSQSERLDLDIVNDDGDGDRSESESDSEPEVCGAEMTDGSICERHPDDCIYHGDD